MSENINKDYNSIKVLDSLRGLAALYVVIHHARLLLTQPYYEGFLKHKIEYSIVDKLLVYFFVIFKYGHEAVLLFFVLSGFVIHLQQAKKLHQNKDFRLSLKSYYSKRIIRIYPTLIFAFFLSFFLDLMLLFIGKNSNSFWSFYNMKSLVENFFLIPKSESWGLNYPLWSLKHEWFFYIVYPFLFLGRRMNIWTPVIISCLLFIAYLFHPDIAIIGAATYTLLVWCFGGVLAEMFVNFSKSTFKKIGWLLLPSILLLLTPVNNYVPFRDLAIGLFFGGVITLILVYSHLFKCKILQHLAFLGTFSYSLYLLHFPVFAFFKTLIIHFSPYHRLPFHYWFVIIGSLLSIPLIYLFYLFIEKPSQHLKEKLFNK